MATPVLWIQKMCPIFRTVYSEPMNIFLHLDAYNSLYQTVLYQGNVHVVLFWLNFQKVSGKTSTGNLIVGRMTQTFYI